MDARKRWIAVARPAGTGWSVAVPRPVGAVGRLLDALRQEADGGPVALGVDFPLGLPRAYAAALPDLDFPAFLAGLAEAAAFFSVCASLDQIGPGRPFYPARGLAGMTRAAHAQALGLADSAALSRVCDRATAQRRAGAPLFWTLGANQTGKAAIAAWRDLVGPALRGPDPPLLWPFAGPFRSLLAPGVVALAETYPAEALHLLGIRLSGSKRRQAGRAGCAPALHAALQRLAATPTPTLAAAITDGFGDDPAGEDRFDCTVGLLCVLGVLGGQFPDTAPDDPWVGRWEGWVLGQAPPAAAQPDP